MRPQCSHVRRQFRANTLQKVGSYEAVKQKRFDLRDETMPICVLFCTDT
jgi:hypothetical protein